MALTWHDKACLHFITLLPAWVVLSGGQVHPASFIHLWQALSCSSSLWPAHAFISNSPISLQGIVPGGKIIIIITQPSPPPWYPQAHHHLTYYPVTVSSVSLWSDILMPGICFPLQCHYRKLHATAYFPLLVFFFVTRSCMSFYHAAAPNLSYDLDSFETVFEYNLNESGCIYCVACCRCTYCIASSACSIAALLGEGADKVFILPGLKYHWMSMAFMPGFCVNVITDWFERSCMCIRTSVVWVCVCMCVCERV